MNLAVSPQADKTFAKVLHLPRQIPPRSVAVSAVIQAASLLNTLTVLEQGSTD